MLHETNDVCQPDPDVGTNHFSEYRRTSKDEAATGEPRVSLAIVLVHINVSE